MSNKRPAAPRWMKTVLVLAGWYNLLWGAAAVFFPMAPFDWLELPRPNYPELWQCIGMIVGVYGLAYLVAARDPYRHGIIVLVGLLGKLFGPLGFLLGDLPWRFGLLLLSNDLVWWVPFVLILRGALKAHNEALDTRPAPPLAEALAAARTDEGVSLAELSDRAPLLLVFLRHFG